MSQPLDPFVDVRRALQDITHEGDGLASVTRPAGEGTGDRLSIDAGRRRRAGIPEVVLADRKRPSEVIDALSRLVEATGRAMASRCAPDVQAEVSAALGSDYEVTVHELARAIVVAAPGATAPTTGGRVGVLCAGTSDAPIAAEASLMAREMGAAVSEAWDVGVAGLHRLVKPLARMVVNDRVDVIVVAAGMDGALPSVVAGLVPVPVIGLPTSVGYGLGGNGVAALLTMLQTCAPGLTVVNIDNGIGAGATAALIANRVAACRATQSDRLGE